MKKRNKSYVRNIEEEELPTHKEITRELNKLLVEEGLKRVSYNYSTYLVNNKIAHNIGRFGSNLTAIYLQDSLEGRELSRKVCKKFIDKNLKKYIEINKFNKINKNGI